MNTNCIIDQDQYYIHAKERLEESHKIQQHAFRNCMNKLEATNERYMQTIARLEKYIYSQCQCKRIKLKPDVSRYLKQDAECIKIKM